MMEKQNTDSMTTVQMKADYAASEIYSTASEAPPAYPIREASSVKIAKIIALTIILSSVIIGSFVLGSVYLQARASCDQMQALDSMLDKELLLESLQQELPKAEALLQNAAGADGIEGGDEDEEKSINSLSSLSSNKKSASSADQMGESDTSYSDNDESADLNRNGNGVNVKMPLELNLSELAHSIMQSNQKSRMNCVIERRQAEEIIDDNNGNMMYNGEPRKRVTGERMAIFCESGTETKAPEPQAEQIPSIMMRPVSYGPVPQHFPLTHMPMQMEPRQPPQQNMPVPNQPQSTIIQRLMPHQFIVRQIHLQPQPQQQQQQQQPQPEGPMGPGFHMPGQHGPNGVPHLVALRFNVQPPQQPDQVLTAPRPMMPLSMMPMPMPEERPMPYQIRNELMELQKREREMQQQQPPPQQPQQPHGVQLQRVPLSLALQRVGITPADLRNIQRMAEERIQQEVSQLNNEFNHMHEAALAAGQGPRSTSSASASSSYSSSDDSDSNSSDESSPENGSDEDSQILQIGRTAFGRSVVKPIHIPVDLMQAITQVENMAGNEKADQAADVEHRSLVENRPNAGEEAEH